MAAIQEIINEGSSSFIRSLVSHPKTRKWLNRMYLRLSLSLKRDFHHRFAKIFRHVQFNGPDGVWKVFFNGVPILMPLRGQKSWLDWETAISIVGHDIEVKETYQALIGSPAHPELFIDIGANYGTHSLLFLSCQIETLTFEPNTSCHSYFKETCRLNRLMPNIEAIALGDKNRTVELSYPEKYTWFGSTDVEVTKELSDQHHLISETVEQKTLDEYLPKMLNKRTVIKIDTEGNELQVLRGGTETLREVKPVVIFESWEESERSELYGLLDRLNYKIYEAPYLLSANQQPLSAKQFSNSASYNFVAVS